jgi:Fe-S cluster assembly protein SufD
MTQTTIEPSRLVSALAQRSPDWLADLRGQALEAAAAIPYPTGREEIWRYTDVASINPDAFRLLDPDHVSSLAGTPAAAERALELTDLSSAGRAVHADSSLVSVELSDEAKAAGVVYMPLEQAVTEHADTLRPRLGSLVPPDDPHRALSLAAHRGGMFLYVPAGVELHEPVQALHWITESGAAILPRTVVVVEAGARVVFNDLYLSDALDQPTLAAPVVEMFIERDARVGWVTWQDWGPGVRHVANVRAQLAETAKLDTLLVTLGADYSRTWKECTLAGEGAESIMLGLYFPHGEQRFEHWTVQDHAAAHTTSDLLYKGAVADTARAVYYGTIRVRPGARRTDAYQANRNLTLSPKAKADTMPQLEIENNDVRCTHGATVGQVDEEQLFYLRSRGIPLEEARSLVVFGFFNEVLGRVTWSGMHERLGEAIRTKMEAGR